ncbi:Gfo/Idh/MocA family oxidoreductase [Gorillibacterium sp. CAU 1737]|uniref:Gfo/Idh/MocA family protein n=1 Tax=Gorillibacterium sp. CAU 1737 TaxID=3140362 RepID=UPI00326174CA
MNDWKVLQVGMGNFGLTWLERVLSKHERIGKVIVVDHHEENLEKARLIAGEREVETFYEAEDALRKHTPDLLINVTQPNHHEAVNALAIQYRIPILCEKPLSLTLEQAMQERDRARSSRVPLMVAENYRYFTICREVKRLLEQGTIGRLHAVEVEFRRAHRMSNYHGQMEQPLLLDVTIHHVDMLRYFTGDNARSVSARGWNPSWSWYSGLTNAHLLVSMNGGVELSYTGSLTCRGDETDWLGSWRFEGESGVLHMANGQLEVKTSAGIRRWTVEQERDSRWAVLDECLASLEEERPGETDVEDNLHTAAIIEAAITSIAEERHVLL